jgi:hypothetical protein
VDLYEETGPVGGALRIGLFHVLVVRTEYSVLPLAYSEVQINNENW